MSSVAEKQLETIQVFVDGYNAHTTEGLLRARSDDCVHAMLPISLGRPPRTNAESKLFFGNLENVMKDFKMIVHKTVNDAEQHMAVVHASASAETPVGHYNNEYAFFLHFNEEGTKIDRIEEFVDSKFSSEFFAKLQEYLKAQRGSDALGVATAAVSGAGELKS